MKFVKCAQEGFKLCHDGFTYTKKAEKKNLIRWEWASRNSDSESDTLFLWTFTF